MTGRGMRRRGLGHSSAAADCSVPHSLAQHSPPRRPPRSAPKCPRLDRQLACPVSGRQRIGGLLVLQLFELQEHPAHVFFHDFGIDGDLGSGQFHERCTAAGALGATLERSSPLRPRSPAAAEPPLGNGVAGWGVGRCSDERETPTDKPWASHSPGRV